MPRVTLSRSTYNPANIKKAIRHRLVDLDLEESDLADKTGISIKNIRNKYESGYWTAEELFTVFVTLKFSDEEIITAITGREKGPKNEKTS